MTRTFCFWGDKRPIAQEVNGTIYWYRVPATLVPLVHELADRPGIVDSDGKDWTGDDFWEYTGNAKGCDLSRIGQEGPR